MLNKNKITDDVYCKAGQIHVSLSHRMCLMYKEHTGYLCLEIIQERVAISLTTEN